MNNASKTRVVRFAKWIRGWHLSILSLLVPAMGNAAPHEEHRSGSAVRVHHVHLSGDKGAWFEAFTRENLQLHHTICSGIAASRGMAIAPLVLPRVLTPMDYHVYYAANRSVTFYDGVSVYIDMDRDCRVLTTPLRETTVMSYAGTCRIDRVRRTAYGTCDAALHASAPVAPSSAERAIATPAMDRVPEHLRDRFLAEHDRLRRNNPAFDPRTQGLNTRIDRVIAGLGCTTMTVAGHERCLAPVRPGEGPAPGRFAPAEAPINGGFPGILLLEREERLVSIEAVAVHLDMPVPDSLFAVPDGFRVLVTLPPRSRPER